MISNFLLLTACIEAAISGRDVPIAIIDRPNKDFVYIFAFIALILFGFLNYKNYRFSGKQY